MNLLHTSYDNLEFYNITSLLINENLHIFSNNKIISFIFLYIIFMVVTLFLNQYINIQMSHLLLWKMHLDILV